MRPVQTAAKGWHGLESVRNACHDKSIAQSRWILADGKMGEMMALRGAVAYRSTAAALALAALLLPGLRPVWALNARGDAAGPGQAGDSEETAEDCDRSASGSAYIPVDNWIYPAVLRLYSLGFLDHIYLGMRPWTWVSLSHMLEDSGTKIENADEGPVTDQAKQLFDAVNRELQLRIASDCSSQNMTVRLESTYSIMRAISGTPLRDSFHLGATIVNDYGRPYENGFNDYSGVSGYATTGRFVLYLRGEFQGAPSAAGYSSSLTQTLAGVDATVNHVTGLAFANQATIPAGPIGTTTQGRVLEAYLSTQVLNHVISFGKQDEWLGPAEGASMAYSNNAENIYALHINRIEPLYVPGLSRFTGPFRYEFLVGALRGHTLMPNPGYPGTPQAPQPNVINPGDPWVHVEKISFRPTNNLEFGFERTALWGGEGHAPVNLESFFRSFFSLTAGNCGASSDNKCGTTDPGARFGAFDFSYRLPFARNWLTLYADSEVHDDLSPIDAPQRASWRPGLYLSHVPGVPRLDLRAEATTTDPPISNSVGGLFMYWESIERQGYTNQGQLFGDWIGREDKGGQAWITWHLSGNEWIKVGARNQKAAKDFIPGGTTLNDFNVQAVKRIHKDFEIDGTFTLEYWKAPVDLPGLQTVTSTTIQLTWFPERKIGF